MEYYIKRLAALFCLVAVLTSNGAEATVGGTCGIDGDCDTAANNEVCVDSKSCGCDSANGYIDDGSGTCGLADCDAPPTPKNGAVDTSGGTEYNNEAKFSCDTGYNPEATVTTKCQADTTWTPATHTCTIKDCGAPATPAHGAVDITAGTEYNNVATFSCDTGYTPEATVTTTCQADKTWTPATHTCTIKDCADPTAPANSKVTLTVVGATTYGAIATVSCSAGFTCNGELTCTITCELTEWTSVVCSGAASIVSGVVLIGVCGLVSVLFHL